MTSGSIVLPFESEEEDDEDVFSEVVQSSDPVESLLELEMQHCDCVKIPMFFTTFKKNIQLIFMYNTVYPGEWDPG